MKVPASLAQALEWMAAEPGECKPFAGGTDLMVLLEQGKLSQGKYLSLWGLSELRGIDVAGDFVSIGALTTYSQIQRHPVLRQEFPLICRAAAETGGVANQNRGTLGGNIANASPAADSPPALLVYDAELELVSVRAARWIPYLGFHAGYKKMNMAGDEIIRRIRLPRTKTNWTQFYRKVGTRKAQAISKVCFAVAIDMQDSKVRDVRIALGSVAPTVLRCQKTEAALRGRAIPEALSDGRQQLRAEISPLDDFRSTADYRTRVAQNILEEFLLQAQASIS